MDYTLKDVAWLTGKTIRTVRGYVYQGVGDIKLATFKKGKHTYTTDEDLHKFLLSLPVRYLHTLNPIYSAPPGYPDLPKPAEVLEDLHLISREQAMHMLQVEHSRMTALIQEEKILTYIPNPGEEYIILESVEEHLRRVEAWHYKREFDKTMREAYPDLLAEAYREAQRIAQVKHRKQKRIQARRERSKGKVGRPPGSKDTRRRKRYVKQYTETPEEYQIT